jgi:large subunit ribosomal protein L30e
LDVDRELRQAVSTGKVILGLDKTVKAVRSGKAKLAILASNCPPGLRGDVERYARLADVSVHIYQGDSASLGLACGKPFLVSAMAIIDPGSSAVLGLGGE